MKKIIGLLFFACVTFAQSGYSQTLPKWASKARKAVFSVITYNKENKILNTGNGFYIDETGTAVSDYSLFKGAERAVIVTADGKELPVKYIMGANSIYDVVKFKAEYDKKCGALTPAAQPAQQGTTVYLLPYSTQKAADGQSGTVEKMDSIGNNSFYYTLNMATTDKTVSCPIMNEAGEVVGLVQKNSDEASKQSFAIGIEYARALTVNALSASDYTLNTIGIRKGLPEDESQALVYLYMAGSKLSGEEYLQLLNEFIATYPKSMEGYQRRASYYMTLGDDEHNKLAAADMKTMLDVAENKADAHYNLAKLIYNYQLALGQKTPFADWTYDAALQEINTALQEAKEPLYYQQLGDICFAQQKYAEAYSAYMQLNGTSLASAASYYSAARAKELTEGADKKEVVALLDSAVTRYKKPYGQEVAPYLYERARLKTDVEDFRGSVADYNDFYDAMMGQVTADFYIIRMQSEMQCRMYQQALNDVDKAVELEPNKVEYWAEKGGVHLRVNQPEEAIKALEKALTIDAKNAPACRMLGYAYILQKQKDKGLKYLQQAKDLGDEIAGGLIEKYKK